MASRSIRPRLLDILENIDIACEVVASSSYDAFSGNRVLQMAIERAVEIISEAVRHIPQEQRDNYPEIPWRNIVAIGNKLRHEYQRVDPDIVWDIAQNHLMELRPVVEALLEEQG